MFSNQYAYINTKLRSRLARRLSNEQFESLIKAKSLNEAVFLLRGSYFEAYDKSYSETGDLRLAEQTLADEEVNLFKGLTVGSSNEESRFIRALLTKFEVENLKIIISSWFNRVVYHNRLNLGQNLYMRSTVLNSIDSDALLNATDYGSFSATLLATPYGAELAKVLESKSLFNIALALDKFYYHQLCSSSNMLLGQSRLMARRFLSREVDFENLISQIRYRAQRFSETNNYNSYFIEGGRLVTTSNIEAIVANKNSIRSFLEQNFPASFNLSDGDDGNDEGVALAEFVYEHEMATMARSYLSLAPDSIAVVAAYFWLIKREHTQVVSVLQGHSYNLSEEAIRRVLCL
jgi:vacuolar-type H+-ATPase subunit C/Vma6